MKINLTLFNFRPLISQGIKSLLEKDKQFNIEIAEIQFWEIDKDTLNDLISDIYIVQFSLNPLFLNQILRLKTVEAKIKIIAIGENYEEELEHVLNYNIDAYLNFNSSQEILINTIENVLKNESFIEPSSTHLYIDLLKTRYNKVINQKNILTPRELEILILICEENTTKMIANKLSISSRTVDNHRKNLLFKTNTKSTLGLFIYALKNKIFAI